MRNINLLSIEKLVVEAAENGFGRNRRVELAAIARRFLQSDQLSSDLPGWLTSSQLGLSRITETRLGLERNGGGVLTIFQNEYPKRLLRLYDPPPVIFYLSRSGPEVWERLADAPTVAIVGSRSCTAYGKRVAASIAKDSAVAGQAVISGLARGIDFAAHQGAVHSSACGKSKRHGQNTPDDFGVLSMPPPVAVIAGGLKNISPLGSRPLAEDLLDVGGLIISEYGVDAAPCRNYFRERNRLIAALADKLILVEAGEKSGSLITARMAIELGIDIGVVPGAYDCGASLGGHRLVADGAVLLHSRQALAEFLGDPGIGRDDGIIEASRRLPDARAVNVLALFSPFLSLSAGEIADELGCGMREIIPVVSELESVGLLARDSSGLYIRVD
ncbi:MAG: DNA-protecting protein DprA [bacterium]|nr:DNA-protecting protein DprA [bacterium]